MTLKDKKGFTLVELIVAISAFIIIIAAMIPILTSSVKYIAQITAKTAYQSAATNIMNNLRANVSNSNDISIFNAVSDDGTNVNARFIRYYTKDNYSSYGYETSSGFTEIVSSSDLKGRKIKVDFECGKRTGTSDTRLAMLYVTISIYDQNEDLTFFNSYPDTFNYYDYDNAQRPDTDSELTYNGLNHVMVYKDNAGNEIYPPEPIYQQRTGLYAVNVESDINVPSSRKVLLRAAVENGQLDLVESIDPTTGNPTYYKNLPEGILHPDYKNVYNECLAAIDDNDDIINSGAEFFTLTHLYLPDCLAYLESNSNNIDYTGTVLKFYDVSE